MSSVETEPEPLIVEAASPRVVSLDIFRGITMAVMIFVNALSGVQGMPWWTEHAHAQEDVMTYVDMVFPFFLFIVGMSMPLSIRQRLKKNASMPALWLHIIHRALGLFVLGLILANAEKADAVRMGINANLWALIGIVGMGMYLNVYPKSARFPAYAKVLKIAGLMATVVMFAIFRRVTPHGQVAWINPSYPEILGLIAYSYVAAAILYVPTRRIKWAPYVWFLVLLAFNCVCCAKLLRWPDRVPYWIWPFDNGAMVCLIMAGVVASSIFLGTESGTRPAAGRAIRTAVVLGVIALIAGKILTPLGISKIRATPTWCLWSIGGSMLLFALLYWVCDVKRHTGWAFLFRSAGANTLLTYLLPDLWYFLLGCLGITYLDVHWGAGGLGVLKTLLFTVLILGISAAFTKAKVRLQL
jgi:heparan-alpha-glucosaminide N-acetyltransferase